MIENYYVEMISGDGVGTAYSSLDQIGSIDQVQPLGQAKLKLYADVNAQGLIIRDHVVRVDEWGGPLDFYFTYSSAVTNVADRWHFSQDKKLINIPATTAPVGQTITLIEADGHHTVYTLGANNVYYAPGRSTGTSYLSFDGTQWIHCDLYNNFFEYYDTQGLLRSRQDMKGAVITYEYDAQNLLTAIQGTASRYEIRRQNSAIAVYLIEGANQQYLTGSLFNEFGLLVETKTENGYAINYNYDGSGYLLNLKQTDGTYVFPTFSTVGGKPFVLTAVNFSWVNLDITYQLSAEGTQVGYTLGNDLNRKLTIASGKIITMSKAQGYFGQSARLFDDTHYAYNSLGQVSCITFPDQSQEQFVYEGPLNYLSSHTKPNGGLTTYTYEATGKKPNLLVKNEYDDQGAIFSTRYVYDTQDLNPGKVGSYYSVQRFILTPQGSVIENRFDAFTHLLLTQRAYLQAAYPVATLPINVSPTLDDMQSWVQQQDSSQVSLQEYTYDERSQPFIQSCYATVDQNGKGIADEHMSFLKTIWNVFHSRTATSELQVFGQEPVDSTWRYDDLQRMTFSEDALQQQTTIIYNDTTQAIQATRPNDRVEIDHYAAFQVVTNHSETASTLSKAIEYCPDTSGRIAVTLDAMGVAHYTCYDQQQRLNFLISSLGNMTQYEYDCVHRFKKTTHYARPITQDQLFPIGKPSPDAIPDQGDIMDALSDIQDPSNDLCSYLFFDPCQRVQYEIDAKNTIKESKYDKRGQRIATIRYANPITSDQLKALTAGGAFPLIPDPTQDQINHFFYNADGEQIGKQDPEGYVIEQVRDCAGRITQEIRYATPTPLAETLDAARPASDPENDARHYYFYDGKNQVILEVDAEGFITSYDYYPNGLVKQKNRYYNPVDASWYQHTQIMPAIPVQHSEDRQVNYIYDALHRLVSSTCVFHQTKEKIYDVMGNVTAANQYDSRYDHTDPQNRTDADKTREHQARFDGFDRTAAETNPFIAQQMAIVETSSSLDPDQKAQQIEAIWANASMRYAYDLNNLKIKATNTLNETTLYYYDTDRRLVLTINPEGAVVEHTYNAFDKITQTRQYLNKIDASVLSTLTGGFITSAVQALCIPSDQDPIDQFAYDHCLQLISHTDPEGYVTLKSYDGFGQVIKEQLPLESQTPSLTIMHDYDLRGLERATIKQSAESDTIILIRRFDNPYGKMTQEADGLGNNTEYFYTRLGETAKTAKIVDAQAKMQHQYIRDAFGRILTDTNATGDQTNYQYQQAIQTTIVTPAEPHTEHAIQTNVFSETVCETNALKKSQIYTHAPDGKVTQATNALVQTKTDTFNTEGMLMRHCDALGIQTSFAYNKAHYLIQKIEDITGLNLTSSFSVDALGRQLSITNPQRVINQNSYDRRGLCVQLIEDYGTDQNPGLCLITQTTFNGQSARTAFIQGDTTTPNQYHVIFQQDGLNRSVGKVVDPNRPGISGLQLTQVNQLDQNNRVTVHVDPKQQKAYFFYDVCDNKRFKIETDGAVTEWLYDDNNRVIARKRYGAALTDLTAILALSDMEDWARTHTSIRDAASYFFYDHNGRERFSLVYVDALNTATAQLVVNESRYDGANRIVERIGYANTIDLSHLPNLTYNSLIPFIASLADPKQDRHTHYVFDAQGQQRFLFDPANYAVEQSFDARGRIIRRVEYATCIPNVADLIKLPPDQIQLPLDSANDRKTYYVFDVLDKPAFIVNPEGAVTSYQHDKMGNITQRCRFAQTINIRDSYGELVLQLKALKPNSEAGDRITEYTIDNLNRTTQIMDAKRSSKNAPGQIESFKHDILGNLTEQTDRAGAVTGMQYDRAKRLTLKTSPESVITTVTRNAQGVFSAAQTNRSVLESTSYDANNNVQQVVKDFNQASARTIQTNYNGTNQLAVTTLLNIPVDDPTKAASFTNIPVVMKDLAIISVYNTMGHETVKQDKSCLSFKVYDSRGSVLYTINAKGAVIGFKRNAFGELLAQVSYATFLKLDLSQYANTGLPLEVLLANLQLDPKNDRTTSYTRDLRGDVNTISRDPVFYYYPDSVKPLFGFAKPVISYLKNAFRENTEVRYNRFPGLPELDYVKWSWRGRVGQNLAEAESLQLSLVNRSLITTPVQYKVTRRTYNAFTEEVQVIKWGAPVSTLQPDTSLAALDTLYKPSAQDRIKERTYDLMGLLIENAHVNVVRQSVSLDAKGKPQMQDMAPAKLSKEYTYTLTGLKNSVTNESGDTSYIFYDARGFKAAEVDVPNAQGDAVLQSYGIDAHGGLVMSTAYINGTNLNHLNAKKEKENNVPQFIRKSDFGNGLEEFATQNGYAFKPISGDGNCFFTAIAFLLNHRDGTKLTPADVRKAGVTYFHNTPALHIGFGSEEELGTVESYTQRMARDNAWAIGPITDAVSLYYKISIRIIDFRSNGDMHHIDINEMQGVEPFLLARTGENERLQHYSLFYKPHSLLAAQEMAGPATAEDRFEEPAIPTPKKPDPAHDQTNLSLLDNRGLIQVRQTPEGAQTITTYTQSRAVARQDNQVTTLAVNPQNPKQAILQKVIDETRTAYDALSLPTRKTTLRNNNVDARFTTRTGYNAFGETISQDNGVNPGIYNHYDQVGRVFADNTEGGSARIRLYDLKENPTAFLQIPNLSAFNIAHATPADLPNLVSSGAASYVENTSMWIDPLGKILQTTFPLFAITNTMQTVKVEMCMQVSKRYPEIGAVSVAWPTLTCSYTLVLTLAQVDHGTPIKLTLKHSKDGGMTGADVSGFVTDQYSYTLQYQTINPITHVTNVIYATTGVLALDTGNVQGSKRMVASVRDDHVVNLTGNISKVTALQLYQGNQLINTFIPTSTSATTLTLELKDVKDQSGKSVLSGQYQIKGVRGSVVDANATLPFTVNTLYPALKPMSREISAAPQLFILETHGQLTIWDSLPLDYQQNDINFICQYTDDQGNLQFESGTIAYDTVLGHYLDNDLHVLNCNFEFAHIVQQVVSLSLSIKLDDTNEIVLYQSQKPIVLHLGESTEVQYKHRSRIEHKTISAQLDQIKKPLKGTQNVQTEEEYVHVSTNGETDDETKSLGGCSEGSDFSIESIGSTESIEGYDLVTTAKKSADVPKQTLKDKAEEIPIITAYLFSPTTVAYITPLPGYVGKSLELRYKDITEGPNPSYKLLQTAGANEYGAYTNVSGMLPANYPFAIYGSDTPDQLDYSLRITEGGSVYSSEAASNPAPVSDKATSNQFSYDAFGNQLSKTDALGHRTDFAYNDQNKNIQTTYPLAAVVNEQGQTQTLATTKKTGFDVQGRKIGVTDENGHTEMTGWDKVGNKIQFILGDGTIAETNEYNLLKQMVKTREASGTNWQMVYNRCNQVVSQTSQMGFTTSYRYDEMNRKKFIQDAENNKTQYGYDAGGHIAVQVQPSNAIRALQYDRNDKLLSKRDALNNTVRYSRDYFGNVVNEWLMNGAQISKVYDQSMQLTHQTSQGGSPGVETLRYQHKVEVLHEFNLFPISIVGDFYTIQTGAAGGQDLVYTYIGGLLVTIEDKRNNSKTTYGYDHNKKLVHCEIKFADQTVRTMDMTLDEKGLPVFTRDTNAQIYTSHDNKGNIRRIQSQYSPYDGAPYVLTGDLWSRSDEADRTIIDGGVLKNKQIQIGPGAGRQDAWNKNGLKDSETIITASGETIKTGMRWDGDARIWKTDATNHTDTTRGYYKNNNLQSYEETTPAYKINKAYQLDANGNQAHTDIKRDTTLRQHQDGEYDAENNDTAQHIFVHGSDGVLAMHYTTEYRNLEEYQAKLSTVWSQKNPPGGPKTELFKAFGYYDSNNHWSGKMGVDNQDGSSGQPYLPETIAFQTTADEGMILGKIVLTPFIQGRYRLLIKERVFTSPDKKVFGSYVAAADEPNASRAAMNVRNINVPGNHGGRTGRENFWEALMEYWAERRQMQMIQSLVGSEEGVFTVLDPAQAIIDTPIPCTEHDYERITKAVDGSRYGDYVPPNPLSSYPPAVESRYTPESNMSVAQISEAVSGGSDAYTGVIARANGLSEGSIVQAGTVVKIPQLQLNCSRYLNNGNYQKLMAVMIGGLTPHFEFAQQPKKRNCKQTFFEAVISLVSIAIAPELSAFIGLTGALGSAAGAGITAGIMDAGMQELAKGVGLINHFEWSNVIEAGLSAGFMNAGMGKELTGNMEAAIKARELGAAIEAMSKLALYYGALNLSEQIANIAINQQKHIDIRQLLASMTQQIADNWVGFAVGEQVPGIGVREVTEGGVVREVTRTEVIGRLLLDTAESMTGAKVTRIPFNLETMIANEAGSYAGGKIANRIIEHYEGKGAGQNKSQMQVKGTEQIEEDSRAPNDRHYLDAAAAGQRKGQNPDFMSAPPGVGDPNDLVNVWLGVTDTGPQPGVQYNKSRVHTTQQMLSEKKAQATRQGVRASVAYSQASQNSFDPFSDLSTVMREVLDPFYTSRSNQAIHFKGNSLNPGSHYVSQLSTVSELAMRDTLTDLMHLDLEGWRTPAPVIHASRAQVEEMLVQTGKATLVAAPLVMGIMMPPVGIAEALGLTALSGVGFAVNNGVEDYHLLKSGTLGQRLGAEVDVALALVPGGVGMKGIGSALRRMGIFGNGEKAIKFVKTPYGKALQSQTDAAIKARAAVEEGSLLYRGGTLGRSAGPEGQFWSLENPLHPDYAKRYGIPLENTRFDFMEVAVMKPGSRFITREAPGVGINEGGGIEVVVHSGEPKLQYFHMPWEPNYDSVKQKFMP